jgi:hypothetical protein
MFDQFRQEIDAVADNLRQPPFQADQPEHADPSLRVELRHKVDVTCGARFTARE